MELLEEYCYCLWRRGGDWPPRNDTLTNTEEERSETFRRSETLIFWKSLPTVWHNLLSVVSVRVKYPTTTCNVRVINIVKGSGKQPTGPPPPHPAPPWISSSTWASWRDVADFRRLDSSPRVRTGAPRRPPRALRGLGLATRLPDRAHVGAGVGVPLRYPAAVSSGSRRWVTPPAAEHGPGKVRGIPADVTGRRRHRPQRGEFRDTWWITVCLGTCTRNINCLNVGSHLQCNRHTKG